MELNKCPKCGGQAKVYGFCVQCGDCGTSTRCFAKQQAAINAWQIGVDLIRRYPVTDIIRVFDNIEDEVYGK